MFLLDTVIGFVTKQADKLIPDKNKKQDQDHEARMGNQKINETLAGNSNVWIAMSIALPRYVVVLLVVYIIVASAFGLPIPEVLQGSFQLLLPLLGL